VLENVGMTSIEPVDYKGQKIVPLQFLKAVLPDPGSLGPLTKGKTCIGCVMKGVKDGKERRSSSTTSATTRSAYREVGSQAISYTTGVPAMIGAMMMMTGKWRGAGVFNMEQLDPDPFMEKLNVHGLPWFVVDLGLIRRNLDVLAGVKERTGCKILLALKGFAMWSVFPLLRQVLDGVCASSPHEARLGREEFGREVHAFAAGFSQADIFDLCATADHIVFNSFGQLEKFRGLVADEARRLGREIELGVRINPEHSEGATPIYDPCSPGSRLGVRRRDFRPDLLDGVTGLHWHNLCEQNADCLERTIAAAEKGFGEFFPRMQYVNFGGGHHITRPDYDVDLLCRLITEFKARHGVQVYLEPGEAVALNTGYLVSTVLDVTRPTCPSPSSTPRSRRTCPTCWKCRTARISWAPACPAKSPGPAAWAASPAWPGTWPGNTPSISRSFRATAWSSRTLPTTPWSRPTPSTASSCQASRSSTRRMTPCGLCWASATRISRAGFPEATGFWWRDADADARRLLPGYPWISKTEPTLPYPSFS
jgi:hypothetical protein